MSLNAKQIELIHNSWAKVVPIADTAAELFYSRLFEIAPEVRPYFKSDMTVQGRKLIAMLNTAVNGLNDISSIVPAVEESGRRHAGYGVRNEHYDRVGEAFLWTLERGLGEDFTAEVRDAWSEVYDLLASTMKDAASRIVT